MNLIKTIRYLIMTDIIEIKNIDRLEYLSTIPDDTINLILIEPPYIISKETGIKKIVFSL